MLLDQNSRAESNLKMLEFVARKLGDLKDEFVFLGGCATALLINDPAVPDIRTTLDVDCIVDVLSLGHYYALEKRLIQQGFEKEGEVICRWRYEDVILDVMPTDQKILGFSNCWYQSAIKQTMAHQIARDLVVQSVSAPYFLATKLEAFKARGKDDYLMSHDFEDIISIIDGRIELLDELKVSDAPLKAYLTTYFKQFLKDDRFAASLPGHLNYGPATLDRTRMVMNRIKNLADSIDEVAQ